MEDFASPTNIQWKGGGYGTVEFGGGDRNNIALFYMRPVHNPARSREVGRPYFEDKVYVKIHPPGERLNIVDVLATDEHKRRFPQQWAQFQQNVQQRPEGTPIEMLYSD